MATKSIRDKIIDTALRLADEHSWEALRLRDVAVELGISLDDIRVHFREKEDLVDRWFDRADAVMLHEAARPDFEKLSTRKRLYRLMMTWFSALAPHRRVTRQMICGKLEPGHVHYQFSGALRVSRTVQWMREAAHRDASLPWRAFEEAALTGIYLMTFFKWMRDDSDGSAATSRLLDRLLTKVEGFARTCTYWGGVTGVKPVGSGRGVDGAPPQGN